MDRKKIWQMIELELRQSKKKHPAWPDHIAAQAGIVCEESGELMRAALIWKYEREESEDPEKVQREQIEKEAIHTAVVAIRFLENLK